MQPYKAGDYEILSNMLNKLKNNETTVKDNLLKVININYQSILAQKVRDDPVTLTLSRHSNSIKPSNTTSMTTEATSP